MKHRYINWYKTSYRRINEFGICLRGLDKSGKTDQEIPDVEYWLLFNNNFMSLPERQH